MQKIKNLVSTIVNVNPVQVPARLQEINSLIITQYHLEIGDLLIYPKEVESYYYHLTHFPDPYVHKNELQSNRLGKLYFHRYGIQALHEIKKKKRAGLDICLSDSEGYYYGMIIRVAKIVNKKTSDVIVIPGPALLQNYVVNHLNNDNPNINWSKITDFESISLVLTKNNAPLKEIKRLYNLPRIGLTKAKGPQYYDLNLRTITDIKDLSKAKTKDAIRYMLDQNIKATMENVYEILGFNSKIAQKEVITKRAKYP